LFERVGHGVILTKAGDYLLKHARRLLRDVEDVERSIRTRIPDPHQILTMGIAPVPGRFLVPQLLKQLAINERKLFINVATGASSSIEEWLSKGLLDLALMYDFLPRPGYLVRVCASEDTWLFGRPDLLSLDSATPADIAGLPMILPDRANLFRKNFERWMGTNGSALSTVCDVADHSTLRGCLLEGIGVTVHARSAFDADIAAGTLRAVPLLPSTERKLSIVTRESGPKQAEIEVLVNEFLHVVKATIEIGQWSAKAV